MIGGEIGRKTKARKGWETLSHAEAVGGIPGQRCSLQCLPTRHIEPAH